MDPALTADDLPGRIPGFDGLVVRSTKVRAAVFDAADRLALVIRAGAGTNTIDTDAAAAQGVFVSNVPGRNAAAVAELTMGLLLAVDRRIPDNVADLRAGVWNKARYSKAAESSTRRWASSASGRSGWRWPSARWRSGCRCSPWPRPGGRTTWSPGRRSSASRCASRSTTLLASSDVVSLHVPVSPETRGLVNAGFLGPDEAGRDPAQHLSR